MMTALRQLTDQIENQPSSPSELEKYPWTLRLKPAVAMFLNLF